MILFWVILCFFTACGTAKEQNKEQAVTNTSDESTEVKLNDIDIVSTETEEIVYKAEESIEVKKAIKSLIPDISSMFYTPSVITCDYGGNYQGVDIGFSCKYTITKVDDYCIWDIEDITCTKYENKKITLDIKSYINKIMSKTSFRVNVKNNNIKYIVYDGTIAIRHDVDNSVNSLKDPLLYKFSKEKAGEYLDYNADEGVKYREAYKFVECFLRAIVGDSPFQISTIVNDCKLTDDEQTDNKQVYSNGYTYTVEKVSDNEYLIGVVVNDVNYCVKLTIYK